MSTKIVCQLDPFGYFISTTIADESPLEPGVFLLPAGAVDAPIPNVPAGERAKWTGQWVFEDIPEPPAPAPEPEPEPTPYDKERLYAYRNEADPLFFKWQAGEGTKEAWLAKRAEIAARFPKD